MTEMIGVGGIFLKARHPEALYAWYERHFGLERRDGAFVFRPIVVPGLRC